ncbi:MAG: aldolase/citrate lyase family protein, partial [Pseudomonadota bacterium]
MTSSIAARPRRSCLYMPGDKARVLEKGKSLPADVIIFDLEDAVAPEAKATARAAVAEAVTSRGYGHRETVIRINGLDTEWGLDDLQAAVAAGPDAILAPKVIGGDDIDRLNDAMDRAGAPKTMGLWVRIAFGISIIT